MGAPPTVDEILATAFGGEIPEDRIGKVAAGFSRRRDHVKAQMAGAADPVDELRALERAWERLSVGIRRRAERREAVERSDAARARHDGVLESASAELRGRRARMSLGQRVDEALGQAAMLSSVPASRPGGGTRANQPDSRVLAGTSSANGLLERPTESKLGQLTVVERYQMVLGQILDRLEAEVDTASRRPITGRAESETREARNARLMRWAGVASHIVSTLDPSLGSPRTIENSRHSLGLRRSDGNEMPRRSEQRSQDRAR